MRQQENKRAAEPGATFAPLRQWLRTGAQWVWVAALLTTGLAHAAPVVTLITGPSSPAVQNQTVNVTVIYDSPMDTTVAPVISFPTPGENALGSMSPTGASWLDANTFQQTYQTSAVVTTMLNVDVAVSGARDTNSELQMPALQADVFGLMYVPPPSIIDMVGLILPDNTIVSPAGARPITTADAGKVVQFFVRYDRATDYGGCGTTLNAFLCPNITFPAVAGGMLGSFSNVQSQWASRTLLRVTWTIAEGGDEFSSVDALIPGGVGRRDDPNFKSTAQLLTGVFSIDTKRPTLTALLPSQGAIQAGDAGGNLALTATFSEPMDTSVAPTMAGVVSGGGAVLAPAAGSWLDSTHYVQNFTIGNGAVNTAISIQVSGALDAQGNPQNAATFSGLFAVSPAVAVPALSPQALALLAALLAGSAAMRSRGRRKAG